MVKHKQSVASRPKNTFEQGGKKQTVTPSSRKKRKGFFDVVAKIPVFVFELLLIWLFLYFWYGDVLHVAEQRGFFAFDSTAMQAYSSQPLGWLYLTGRFLLLSCVSPLSGSLLIALMLVVAAWLLDNALCLRRWWRLVAIALPFGYVGYLFCMDLNLVYLREVSWIMTIPLIALVVCVVLTVAVALVRKKRLKVSSFWKRPEAGAEKSSVVACGLVTLMFAGSVAMAETYAQNCRITCEMESYMYDERWDDMVKAAKKASHPSRTVTGLYAVALNQNGEMATELFNIPMQYGNAHLSRKDGTFDSGIDFFVINCDFYAGLVRSAYHEAMEQTVLNGPSIDKLKIMVKCALIDKENALAEKYLAILKKVPFESSFVEKYSDMLADYNKVLSDENLAKVIELQPVNDSFEQNYREPLFLGYNVKLTEAKSIRGLNNSLYACLYSKDLNGYWERIVSMIQNNVMLSKVFEEAIVIKNLRNLPMLKQVKLSPYTLQGVKDFVEECFGDNNLANMKLSKEEKTKISKEKAVKYKDKYLGTYQYYYYFQNVPDENYVSPDSEQKGGVN